MYNEFQFSGKIPASVNGMVKDLINVGPSRRGNEDVGPEFAFKNCVGARIATWIENGGDIPNVELSKW